MKKAYIYGYIYPGEADENTIQSVIDTLKKGEDLEVWINSGGGSVFTGIGIYNILAAEKANRKINVKIIGLAASMASVIACIGDTVEIYNNAQYLVHNPSAMSMGDAEEMKKKAGELEKLKKVITDIYIDKTGLTETELSKLMDEDRFMDPTEAMAKGFIDKIIKPNSKEIKASIEYQYAAIVKNLNSTQINTDQDIKFNNDGGDNMPELEITAQLETANGKIALLNSQKDDIKGKLELADGLNVEITAELQALKTEKATLTEERDLVRNELESYKEKNKGLQHTNFVNEETAFIDAAARAGKVTPVEKAHKINMLVNLREMDASENSLYAQEKNSIDGKDPIVTPGTEIEPDTNKNVKFNMVDVAGEGKNAAAFIAHVEKERIANNRSYSDQELIEIEKIGDK